MHRNFWNLWRCWMTVWGGGMTVWGGGNVYEEVEWLYEEVEWLWGGGNDYEEVGMMILHELNPHDSKSFLTFRYGKFKCFSGFGKAYHMVKNRTWPKSIPHDQKAYHITMWYTLTSHTEHQMPSYIMWYASNHSINVMHIIFMKYYILKIE